MRRTKKAFFIFLMVLLIALIFFLIGEVFCRIFIGKRLIAEVEESGLYYFEPNQNGWYTHILGIPTARINNIGARGQDINLEELNKTKKYVFLGDSFTFGWILADKETIPYYFAEEKNATALNYGNGGYGIEHMTAMYNHSKNFLNKGDEIIIILIKNDFYRDMLHYKKSWMKETFWWVRSKSSFISFIWVNFRNIFNADETVEPVEEKKMFKGFEDKGEKLVGFDKLVEKNKQKLTYVFYEYNRTEYSVGAKAFCEKNGLSCITDIYKEVNLKNANESVYCMDGVHPSAEFNRKVAKRIINSIN